MIAFEGDIDQPQEGFHKNAIFLGASYRKSKQEFSATKVFFSNTDLTKSIEKSKEKLEVKQTIISNDIHQNNKKSINLLNPIASSTNSQNNTKKTEINKNESHTFLFLGKNLLGNQFYKSLLLSKYKIPHEDFFLLKIDSCSGKFIIFLLYKKLFFSSKIFSY